MTSQEIVRIIDDRLEEMGVSQKDFCAEIGISSSAMSAWRNGSMPKPDRLRTIERALNIRFSDYEKEDQLENLREDLRILLRSARDLQPSSVYQLIATIEKEKERENAD